MTASTRRWWHWLLPWRRPRIPAPSGPPASTSPDAPPELDTTASRRAATIVRGRGLALRGTVWRGGEHQPESGRVVVDAHGRIARIDPAVPIASAVPTASADPAASNNPAAFDDDPVDLETIDVPWIGPALIDTHVCPTTVASSPVFRASGLAAVRGIGHGEHGPHGGARLEAPDVAIVDLPFPFPQSAAAPDAVVAQLARDGVTVIRVDLTAAPELVAAAVNAAHDAGLAVTAEAGTLALVGRALDAGVDELLRLPHMRLPEATVDRLADAGVGVSSTLQAFFSDGRGREAAQNAVDLVRAGVPLRYGTCVGRARLGVDPRELDRLADAGLGRLGALRAATDIAAGAAGFPGAGELGLMTVGRPANLVVLADDPLVEPHAWHTPRLVIVGGRRVNG